MPDGDTNSGSVDGSVSSIASELRVIQTKLDSKPGPFVVAGLMLAVVGIPVGVLASWFPNEVNRMDASVTTSIQASNAALAEAKAATETAVEVDSDLMDLKSELDRLALSMARIDADDIEPRLSGALTRILPSNLLDGLRSSNRVRGIRYSNFDKRDWVFIERATFNNFSDQEQQQIKRSFEQYRVLYFIEP